MTEPILGNPPIIVGVDGSEPATEAVRWAARAAARHEAPLVILHGVIVPELYFIGSASASALLAPAQEQGDELVRQAAEVAKEQVADLDVHTEVHVGVPARLLIDRSDSARTIVLGSRGSGGFAELLLGSTTAAVASHANCPVMVARGDGTAAEPGPDAPIVVGVDADPGSDGAIDAAFQEASMQGVPLVAVHTWSDADGDAFFSPARMNTTWESINEAEQRVLAERIAGWQEKYPDVQVRRVVTKDRPRHELLERSKQARMVVVGSRGRGGFTGMLLGSTSQALIHHAHCPVLVVRTK